MHWSKLAVIHTQVKIFAAFFYPWFCTYLCRKPMPPRNVWMSTTMIKACVQSISSVIRTVGNTGWVFLDIFMFRFSNYNDKTVKNMLETNDHSFDEAKTPQFVILDAPGALTTWRGSCLLWYCSFLDYVAECIAGCGPEAPVSTKLPVSSWRRQKLSSQTGSHLRLWLLPGVHGGRRKALAM